MIKVRTPVDIDGAPLSVGDRVRVVEAGPTPIIREITEIGHGEHLDGYIKVTGILGFANGNRFRKVQS